LLQATLAATIAFLWFLAAMLLHVVSFVLHGGRGGRIRIRGGLRRRGDEEELCCQS
jgi:hypothetical protein